MKKRKPKQSSKKQRPRDGAVKKEVVKLDIPREVRYITERAQSEKTTFVRLGNLLLFSTRSRDAWILDIEDQFALCLCRDGDPQPFHIVGTPKGFLIEWPASFTLDDQSFIVRENSGRIIRIDGYPVVEITAFLGET